MGHKVFSRFHLSKLRRCRMFHKVVTSNAAKFFKLWSEKSFQIEDANGYATKKISPIYTTSISGDDRIRVPI